MFWDFSPATWPPITWRYSSLHHLEKIDVTGTLFSNLLSLSFLFCKLGVISVPSVVRSTNEVQH